MSLARVSSANLRSFVCLILYESSISSVRPLSQMSCNKLGKFSVDHTFSSPNLSKCVLILSVDGFFLVTEFMCVMVSVTLTSIISVSIGSKIIQF